MREMSEEERRRLLSEGPRTGVLTTVREDGRPHAAPVWFIVDGDHLVFTTWEASVKGRNLARDDRASLVVDDPTYPFAFVVVEGRCELLDLRDDLATLQAWAARIAARYVPADEVEVFAARNGVAGELLVRLHPEHVIAQAEVAS